MEKAWNKSCLSCGLLLTQMKETSSDSYRQYNRILQTLMKLERKGVLELFAGDCPLEDTDTILGAEQQHYVKDYIRIKVRNSYVNIMYSDIIYIESCNNRCILHTADEEYPLYMKLDDIEQQIADEKSRFLRCHRSYIVNMDHITAVDEQFRLDNGDSALIRSRSRAQIKKTYLAYSQSGKVKHKKQ